MMSAKDQKKGALVPRLRFPEFQNEWYSQALGAIASIIKEKAGNKKCTLMSIMTGVGLISQIDKFGKEIAGDQYKNYIIVHNNDFAYNKSATKEYPQGFIALYTGPKIAAVPNSIFTCFKVQPERIIPAYLNYLFLGNFHGKWLQRYITVGARAHGSLSIDDDDLLSLPIPYPKGVSSLGEQQKIADCLSSLDKRITAETSKLDTLKDHKKGLLKQLFPAEGETLPQLRFPEFRDAGEWEIQQVGKKIDLLTGYPFNGIDISEIPKGSRLLRGINVTEGFVRHSQEIDRYYNNSCDSLEKFKLKVGDLVIGMDGSKVGKNSAIISDTDVGSLLVQRVARIRTKCTTLTTFIFHHINSKKFHLYVDKINTSSGIPHISAKQIKDFEIAFPSTPEQQQIADCLSSLDELITAQAQKIDLLKTHKKGLMQQLFPVIDEAKA